ncbi:MAG: hypothetical protein ACKVZH_03855 [Blastocatellia bacterium]
MLPLGVYPLAQIEQEKNPVNQIIQLVSLLEYLLSFVSPNLLGKDGKPATVGERVDAHRALFANPPDVFFGIGVRNNLIHAKSSDVTEVEIKRAVGHLSKAVREISSHQNVPAAVRQELFIVATFEIANAPTRAVTTTQLPPTPPTPNFGQFNQAGQAGQTVPIHSTPLAPTIPQVSPTTASPSFTTKVTPRSTMTNTPSESGVSTATIRNIAIALAVLAAVLFLAKPVWNFGKERLYGSEENTRITRTQAETALKTIKSHSKKPGFAAKIVEADAVWRDAELAFNQGKFKDAEQLYRRLLSINDELALKDTERKDAQTFFDEMNKSRAAAQTAQAAQYATTQWQEAENLKRAADTASKNGDSAAAKQNALQAQQKYDEAKAAADTAPKLEPSPTPPASGAATPPTGSEDQRVRPRPNSE